MAVLQKIRNKSVLLVTVIAIALVLFIVQMYFESGSALINQSKQNVGEVSGKSITVQEYQEMVDQFQTVYEIQRGSSSVNEDELNQIKDQAWNNYIQSTLIKEECEKLGLTVTDEEVAELVRAGASQLLQIPMFMNQQTGRYDYSIVKSFVDEYNRMKKEGAQIPDIYEKVYKYYAFVQSNIRDQYLMAKYQNLLAKCMLSNKIEAKSSFGSRIDESDIVLASFPYASYDDSKINVTDEEINKRYNEEKEKYRQFVETRDIKFIDIQVKASKADIAETEKEMNECYNKLAASTNADEAGAVVRSNSSLVQYSNVMKSKSAFPNVIASKLDSVASGETFKPEYDALSNSYYTFKVISKGMQADSVLYRQLQVVGKDEASIKNSADSIVKALSAGANFKDIAKKYNQTGDSLWITTNNYEGGVLDADNAKFINTLFTMGKGATQQLTLSNGATVILQVLDTKNLVEKYNVAAIMHELKFSDDTYSKEYNKFSAFVAANNTLDKFEANAEKNGYRIQTRYDITNNMHNISGVHNTREALKWIFEDAKAGDMSQLYECGDNDHMMYIAVTGINKEGYRDINKVKDIIAAELKEEKKADNIVAELKNINSIEQAAKAKNAVVDTVTHVTFANPAFVGATNSSEPLLSASVSATANGKFGGPVKGENGVYMFKVIKKSKTADKYDEKNEMMYLSNMAMRMASSSIFNDLYLKAEVKDNRYLYF